MEEGGARLLAAAFRDLGSRCTRGDGSWSVRTRVETGKAA
jgi:hypothetical protein